MSKRGLFFLLITVLISKVVCLGQPVSLADYIETAKTNSPLLRELRNNVSSSNLDSQKIRASYLPQVGFTSINSYAPSGNNWGYDAAVTNGGQFSSLVGANKTFVGRDNLKTQYKSVRLVIDSIANQGAIAQQDLVRTVTAQYLTTYGDQQLLLANQEISVLLKNEETILKSLTQDNIYRQADYLTFLVTQNQQSLQLKQLQIQYQTDFATLNYLCGILDTAASGKTLLLPDISVKPLAIGLNTVFYRKFTLDSLRLTTDAKLTNLAYRPVLRAFADAGYNAVAIKDVYHNFGTSAGLSLTFPIFDGGRRKILLRQIALQEDTRQGYQDFFTKQYSQQIAGLIQQLSATETLATDINAQINYARGLIDVNEKLLKTGDARIPDFVIAINNYLTAKNLLAQNQVSRLQIINQVNYWNR